MKRIKKPIKIAITGGIGSGKSFVAELIKKEGYPVYSADEIYKTIRESEPYQKQLLSIFPEIEVNHRPDFKLLGKIVFSDAEKLEKLNRLSHPLVMDELLSKMEGEKSELVFAEVPLLLEGKFEKNFDYSIVILRDEISRIQSVIKRDGLTKEEIEARIKSQYDYSVFDFSDEIEMKNNMIFFPIHQSLEIDNGKERIKKIIEFIRS